MKTAWMPIKAYTSDRDLVKKVLVEQLDVGSLAAVLGAGVSKDLEFPLWWELVRDTRREAGFSDWTSVTKKTPANEISLMIDAVENKASTQQQYTGWIQNALYKSGRVDDHSIRHHDLLIGLGALMAPSSRGNIKNVITFNFDDVLERYLRIHGFVVDSVVSLPRMENHADVIIYHVHGYIPSPSSKDSARGKPIFSELSFDDLLANKDRWYKISERILEENVCLFVGLSTADKTLGPLLTYAKSANQDNSDNPRPTGFWLIGPHSPRTTEQFLLDRNVVPIRFTDKKEIWKFLFEICDAAAEANKKTV
jgi:hypothetical protein